MYNIFSFERANSVEELKFEGDKFLYRTISDEDSQAVVDLRKECDEYEKKAQPPLWQKILQGVLLIMAFCCTIGVVLQNKSLIEMVETQLPFVILAVVSMVGLIVMIWINRAREKRFTKTDEFKSIMARGDELVIKIRNSLGISTQAKELDVLAHPYKIVNGERVNSEKFDFLPLSNFVYMTADGKLCVSDLERVYAIDKKDIVKISYVKGPVLLSRWTKDIPIKDARYKDYDLKKASQGMVRVCGYYNFEIKSSHGQYALAVAPYDAKDVAHMLGKKLPAMKN